MNGIRKKPLLRSLLIGCFVLLAIIPGTIHNSSADSLFPDKRINQGDHLGGAVIYCQNDFGLSYNGTFDRGRIVVLQWNEETQSAKEVLSLNWADYNSVPVPDDPPGEVLLASGGGYDLYLLSDGNFELRGKDEYGKDFSFIWPQCDPVVKDPGPELGPAPDVPPPPVCNDGCDCCETQID